ncbi:MAG TPA: hypothetical protein VHA07_03420 [Devosia sp.]|nr:hypothetical protein [Devosia sp.]
MRNLVLPLALAATLLTGSVALAATNHTVTGIIKAIDLKACTVKVDKIVYHFAKGCDFSALKIGEKVEVTGHVYKKLEVGTKIVAAPATPPKSSTTTTSTGAASAK